MENTLLISPFLDTSTKHLLRQGHREFVGLVVGLDFISKLAGEAKSQPAAPSTKVTSYRLNRLIDRLSVTDKIGGR